MKIVWVPHRYSEVFYGVVAVGAVRVALRPSEDTQKSCGER